MADESSTPGKKWKYDVYFPHKAGARNDPKLVKVFLKFGYHGLGVYWSLMEILREQPEYKYPSGDVDALAHSLSLDMSELSELLALFVRVDLIKKDDGFYYSSGLLDNMKRVAEKSEKARQSVRSRWEKNKRSKYERNTNVSQTYNERNTNDIQVNKSKVKPFKGVLSLLPNDYVPTPAAEASGHALEGLASAWPYQTADEKKMTESLIGKVRLADWADEIANELNGTAPENVEYVKKAYPGGIVEFLTEKTNPKPEDL